MIVSVSGLSNGLPLDPSMLAAKRFDNGERITPRFNAGERVLAESMKGYWGAFVRQGVPTSDKTDAAWPIFHAVGQLKSLQENDRSFVLSTEQFKREHDCKFWDENEQ
jgi:carboxylesterase type B